MPFYLHTDKEDFPPCNSCEFITTCAGGENFSIWNVSPLDFIAHIKEQNKENYNKLNFSHMFIHVKIHGQLRLIYSYSIVGYNVNLFS